MLSIEKLVLRLPGSRARRAESIARRAARELAGMPLAGSARLDRLRVPPVEVAPGASDDQVALRVAEAIHAQVTAQGTKTTTR